MTDREDKGIRVNVEDSSDDSQASDAAKEENVHNAADSQETGDNNQGASLQASVDEDRTGQDAANSEDEDTDEEAETGQSDWEQKYEDEHEKRLRAVADLQNFRRRANERRAEQLKFANEKLLTDLLEVLDNFDQALCSMDQEESDAGTLVQGVQMIHRQLEDLLARYGVTEIAAEGETFDPNYHEAVERVETDEAPEMTIVDVTSPGYMLHDR
ncbi:MAG: nucleotide exchange factor GrpE, partial [Armatimonadota bacterium]